MTNQVKEVLVHLRGPHSHQVEFIESSAKRKVIRAGRRGGKTVGVAILAVQAFLAGKRVLYAAPVEEQINKFWFEACRALDEPIRAGIFVKNETEHSIEKPRTENRLRAKTAWNANTLRGDYADLLLFDEYQIMAEDAWELVGAPMLLDNDGNAVFIYTPPSLVSQGVSKARDPRHAAKLYQMAKADTTGRWATFNFTSHDNPYISVDALREITKDMSKAAYRKEILAEDDDILQSQLVYGAFDERVCLIPRQWEKPPKDWQVFVGHDFGIANPAALFFAKDPDTGYNWAWYEYLPGGGRSPYEHTGAWKEIVKDCLVMKRVGGNKTTEEETRQGYTAQGWPIQAPMLKEVKAQFDRVIALMEHNKVFIFSDLVEYIDELRNCLWEIDEHGKPLDKVRNEARYHLSACARYILSDFTPETSRKKSSESYTYARL